MVTPRRPVRLLDLTRRALVRAGAAAHRGRFDDSTHQAALGRELAANDWHVPEDWNRRAREARNVELVVRASPGAAALAQR